MDKTINAACEAAGGASALAHKLGIAAPTVYQWLSGKRPIPPAQCLPIEQATGGAVTRYDLRPDIFGAAPASSEAA